MRWTPESRLGSHASTAPVSAVMLASRLRSTPPRLVNDPPTKRRDPASVRLLTSEPALACQEAARGQAAGRAGQGGIVAVVAAAGVETGAVGREGQRPDLGVGDPRRGGVPAGVDGAGAGRRQGGQAAAGGTAGVGEVAGDVQAGAVGG